MSPARSSSLTSRTEDEFPLRRGHRQRQRHRTTRSCRGKRDPPPPLPSPELTILEGAPMGTRSTANNRSGQLPQATGQEHTRPGRQSGRRRPRPVIGLTPSHRSATCRARELRASTIVADIVVTPPATGQRGEAILGRDLPLARHVPQYIVTVDVPALPAARSACRCYAIPTLLLPAPGSATASSWPLRVAGDADVGRTGVPHTLPTTLERRPRALEPYIEDGPSPRPLWRKPVSPRCPNGPIPIRPPAIPMSADAASYFSSIATRSFLAFSQPRSRQALAEWAVHARRMGPLVARLVAATNTAYATAAIARTAKPWNSYQNEYAPAFPFEDRPAVRPEPASPLYDR